MAARRAKQDAVIMPESLEQVDVLVAEIGDLLREQTINEEAMNEELQAVRDQWGSRNEPIAAAIEAKTNQVAAYAQVHRAELTDDGKTKTVKLRSGELRWRFTPPAVSIRGVDDVLMRLKQLGLEQFIRIKETVNKEAMLDDPVLAESVEGVTISRKEEFVVAPNSASVELVRKP